MAGTEDTKAVGSGGSADLAPVDWGALIGLLPEGGDDDATARIVQDILDAQSPEEAGSGKASKLEVYNNHVLRVLRARQAESTIADGPPKFIIVDAVDLENGKDVVVTTSAGQPAAMIVKFHISDWLPADFRVVVREKATRAGYHPINLEYLGQPL